ncbi:hypothetical protein C9374_007757 [Naegleria lovaniensis]|uniref:Uncharacterized protein n=1 Tax=Naegleria lovaniensis TaxID=51637 RepID=A0AA88GGR3_NAELO|nr:uncharacterized protein C9374_007757 [Naegleria lovaniensis]KAG2379119.1 hypothetical protein C9374_007757 [Naegleria lovaniensis]
MLEGFIVIEPPQRPLTLTRMTSLSISVMCILKKAITDEHLKELSLCHCNTLKKLDLNNIIEGISCQGLNECLNNLQKLNTMSMETNSYSATKALRTLVQNACPKKEWKYIDLSAKDIFKTRITFHRDVEDVEPERKKKKYDAIPFTHE